MQQNRLEGWMVRQIENADLAKETVIQLPTPKYPSTAPLSGRITRPSNTPRRINGGVATSRRSVAAIAGQEMCSILPTSSTRVDISSNRKNSTDVFQKDENVEKRWRSQFHDHQQPCIEGGHVDRTKVLHNKKEKQQRKDEQSPLFLWGLPHEHILDFIRQSVLPSSWVHSSPQPVREWEAVSNEEDEAARVRRVVSNVLASSPSKTTKKPSSPRAPSPPRSPSKTNDGISSPRRNGGMSPRLQSTLASVGPMSPRSTQVSQRAEDKIQKFIAELRADPNLWAAFQRDVEHIQHQYCLRNCTSDKIRENKEHARTPRSKEDHEQSLLELTVFDINHCARKKQVAERMERTQRKREQIIQLEDERLAAKREAYLRRVNPTRELESADIELTVRYRRRKIWLHVVFLVTISQHWHNQLVQTKHVMMMAKIEGIAASYIQRIWRKWKWQHASKHTVVVYTWLRKCMWKLLLRVRCRRRVRNAMILRQFMLANCTESNATRNFKRVMTQWRSKVVRAQKACKSFVNCNRARLQVLSMWWDEVDHERQRMDRQHNSNADDSRRPTVRNVSAPGSAGSQRRSSIQPGAIAILEDMNEKLANMQMLLTPIEIQRLQQTSIQIVKIPKSIKLRLLTEHLTNARKEFKGKKQAYKEMILCASYAREVKLEEARAIVQSSVNWDGTAENNRMARTGSTSRITNPPPCFLLFSDPNGAKTMEALVRRGVQLTLDADPELKALVSRQQDHRSSQSSRRTSVSFSGAAVQTSTPSSPSLSPSPRNSILKKLTQKNIVTSPLMPIPPSILAIDKHNTPTQAATATLNQSPDKLN